MIPPALTSALPASHRRRCVLALLLGIAATIFAATLPAEAAGSPVCRRLEAELASARYPAPSARAQRYDGAIDRQREQMAIARQQARDAGCGYALSGATVRQCASINATLDRMARNLDSLERNRARFVRPERRRSREAILAALDANGCRDAFAPERTPLGDMLDEAAQFDDEGPYDRLDTEAAYGERFRTLCVRSCDGYFYPMSNGATVTEFERDQRKCEASCTGTDMQIFYGPQGSDDIGAMRSTRSGEPYARMPTAFMHQNVSTPRPAQCGCGLAKDYAIIGGTPPSHAEEPVEPDAGASSALSEPHAVDPEDGAAEGAIAPVEPTMPAKPSSIIAVPPPKAPAQPTRAAAPDPVAKAPSEAPTVASPDRAVRVVGPEFLPDPAGAIDLRTKDPRSGR